MPPRASRSKAASISPPVSTNSTRSKKRVSSSEEEQSEEEEEEEEEEESEEEVQPKSRKNVKVPPPPSSSTRSSRSRTSLASSISPPEKQSISKKVVTKAPVRRSARNSIASSVAESVEEEEDEEEEEEAVVVAPKKRGKKVIESDPEEEEDEEEEQEASPAPIIKARRGAKPPVVEEESEEEEEPIQKVIEATPTPSIASSSDDDDDEALAELLQVQSPSKPLKRTPTKPKSKKMIIQSESEEEEEIEEGDTVMIDAEDIVEAAAEEEPAMEDAMAEDEVIEDGLVETEAAEAVIEDLAPEVEEEVERVSSREATPEPAEEEPIPVIPSPIAPPPKLAPTAQDLTSQARLAALNHLANEKEREKEREGKPRLVIHQMILENFKSYRGRGVIGPFHKSFSSIVGPNGSGKSNTIDALLFVFGYRASKMRQGKLSELIHNSGPSNISEEASEEMEIPDEGDESDSSEDDGKKKKGKGKKKKASAGMEGGIGSCTVEVWFREIIDLPGKDAFTVVPGSQLIVARTAYRNNSSKYTINGKLSNFTEVTTLLKARGIDLDHNRFLILQGEVESIAQMKPKGSTIHDEGLLEYLEDIIGTTKYKVAISEALVEVERLNELRGEKMSRLKLVEREKAGLEGRKKECDVYLRDQNELVHNQSALFQVSIHNATQNSEIYQIAVDEAGANMATEVEAQADTLKEVKLLQETYDGLSKDTKSVTKATNEITQHLAALDRAEAQLQEKIKHASSKSKKLKKTIQTDTHAHSEAQTWVRNNSEEIEKVRTELDKMENTLGKEEDELESIRDSLKGKTEVFTTEIESLQVELQPWASKISQKTNSIDLISNEKEMLLEKTEMVKKALKDVEENLQKLETDGEEKTNQLDELRSEKKQVEKEIKSGQAQINEMNTTNTSLRTKVSAARQKSDEVKASQAATKSQSNVLSSLTKLKEQGRLPGFHGRLGNLGRIDDKYDIAISTACPALDNLVTDTVNTGQGVIEHLRKNDLGRANVMCLDRLSLRNMDPIDTPENVPRLFDLITVKEEIFRPCFFQAISNTLVAETIEQANRIAFPKDSRGKRWRVVTLDGKLIDISGTMSGGGGKPSRGGMSSKLQADVISPAMIAKCEQEREIVEEELKEFLIEREEVESNLRGLSKRLPIIETEMDKIEMDLKTITKRREEASRRETELKTQEKPEAGVLKKIATLEKDITSQSKELEKLLLNSSSIEDSIQLLQEKILEVGGVKLRSQQFKVSDLKSRIDHSSDRLTKAEVAKARSEKDVTKLSKAIETNSAALEITEEELDELSKAEGNGVKDSENVRGKVEEAQQMLEEKVEELREMKLVLDEQLEVIIQFKAKDLELKQDLKEKTRLLEESKSAIKHWSDQLGKLKLNDIDEDDEEEEEAANEEGKTPAKDKENVLTLNSEIRQFTPDEISEINVKVVKGKIAVLQERIGNMSLDLAVLKEYARREKEFLERANDLEIVTKKRDLAKKLSDDLRNLRLKEFMEGFGIISMKLKEMYQMITLGGNAELELVDSLDPFSEGIIFSVMPPKKSWKNISNLSGGEKTLSSLALVFALHVFKPTPLYFMDEIDAALDFRNVSIVANYIRDRTKNAQFIIISLRNNMFELSSRLIGIYKHDNATRSVAIDNAELTAIAT